MYVFRVALLFILFTCGLEANIRLSLLSTVKFDIIHSKGLSSNNDIPEGTYINIIKFIVKSRNFKNKILCLNILSQKETEPGEVYLAEGNSDCESSLFSEKKVFSKKYYNYEIKINNDEFRLNIDKEKIHIPFINIKKRKHQKLSSHKAINGYGPVSIAINNGGEVNKLLDDGDTCLEVDSKCNLISDQCHLCQGGSYYFKNSECTQRYSKKCGVNKCGLRGEVACLRGPIASQLESYCIQDSPFGFCSDGSRVACVNNELICE